MVQIIILVSALATLAVIGGIAWAILSRRALPNANQLTGGPARRNREAGAPPPEVVNTAEIRTP
jgi:hypothetical protein